MALYLCSVMSCGDLIACSIIFRPVWLLDMIRVALVAMAACMPTSSAWITCACSAVVHCRVDADLLPVSGT